MLRTPARSPHRPRALAPGRGTTALGVVAFGALAVTGAVEYARVWRSGSAPSPLRTDHLLAASRIATRETVAVVREGYRSGTTRENAAFNMLAAFVASFGAARAVTAAVRAGRGPSFVRDVVIAERHVHHFVPGLVLGLGAGGASIVLRSEDLDRWLALPFGAGAALVLDEAALLLELEDVYWSEEGVLSVQLSLATIVVLALVALGVRLLRRGEPQVLGAPVPPPVPGGA